jgi:hypothetical protein
MISTSFLAEDDLFGIKWSIRGGEQDDLHRIHSSNFKSFIGGDIPGKASLFGTSNGSSNEALGFRAPIRDHGHILNP